VGGNVRCPPRRIKVQLILPQRDACPIEGDVQTRSPDGFPHYGRYPRAWSSGFAVDQALVRRLLASLVERFFPWPRCIRDAPPTTYNRNALHTERYSIHHQHLKAQRNDSTMPARGRHSKFQVGLVGTCSNHYYMLPHTLYQRRSNRRCHTLTTMYFDAIAQLTVFPLPTIPFLLRVFDVRSSLSTMRLVSRQLQNCDSSNNVQGALLLADTHPEAEFPAVAEAQQH
jgi:hypothetical protein